MSLQSKQHIVKIRPFHTHNDVFEEDYSWSDPNGPMKVLHDYNKVRIPFIIKTQLTQPSYAKDAYLRYLKRRTNGVDSNVLQGLKVFEVGCGGGILSEQLAMLGAKVLAIDSSKKAISHAVKRLEQLNATSHERLNITYVCSDLKLFSYSNDSESCKFSMIVCSEVLEHMSMEEKLLFFSVSTKILSDDGTIIITTPSKSLYSLFANILLAENVFQSVPKGTHCFSMFISHRELLDIAAKYRFQELDSTGLLYIPFCRKFIPVGTKSQLYMTALRKAKDSYLQP